MYLNTDQLCLQRPSEKLQLLLSQPVYTQHLLDFSPQYCNLFLNQSMHKQPQASLSQQPFNLLFANKARRPRFFFLYS